MLEFALEALTIIFSPTNLGLMLLGVAVGMTVGILPGLGGTVGMSLLIPFIFGKEGGALIPTLLFGIPGSGGTAVLLGAFILLGLQPGPRMLKETGDLNITILIIMTLAIANVFGTLACLGLTNVVARLATIPAARLTPFILVIMLTGAYQSTRHWGDLLAFVLIGLLGWTMRRLKYPLPPLLIGFVLSEGVERYLWLSTARYEWEWLSRQGVIVIALIMIVLTYASFRVNQRTAAQADQMKKELADNAKS